MDAKRCLESALATGLVPALSEDVVWIVKGDTPWSGTYRGKVEVERALLGPLRVLVDGRFRLRADRFIAEGDTCVVLAHGDNRLLAGGRYDNEYCLVCRVAGDRIVEIVEYMDTDLVRRVLTPPRP